ncbi:MAG: hypothetical protein M1826_003881 [Phylliscum demangeonii]|nr:MAG: hypothetical protein M1826_003881 [Phylliscum demangeonii]
MAENRPNDHGIDPWAAPGANPPNDYIYDPQVGYQPNGPQAPQAPQQAGGYWVFNPEPAQPAAPPAAAPAPAPGPRAYHHYHHYQPYANPGQYYLHPNAFYYGQTYAPQPLAPAPGPPEPELGNLYNPFVWPNKTEDEVSARMLALAQEQGVNRPVPLVPQGATPGQMWWVRDLDGTYVLRNTYTIENVLKHGYWAFAQQGGYPYFIRQQAP